MLWEFKKKKKRIMKRKEKRIKKTIIKARERECEYPFQWAFIRVQST